MTPQNTPLEISEACCAHSKVVYKRVNHPEGGGSDSWICTDCNQNFWPAGMTAALTAKLREENEQLRKQKFDQQNYANTFERQRNSAWEERDQLKLRVEELESQNKTFRAAQKACETCDTTEFESLQKQIVWLRQLIAIVDHEVVPLLREAKLSIEATNLHGKCYALLNESTNFSHLYVRREVLEKLFELISNAHKHGAILTDDFKNSEALTLARKELGE